MFFKSHALASSTRATQRAQWNKYLLFCDNFGQIAMPADAHQMCRFIVYLAQSMKYTSINNYLSGIILLHKMYGYEHDLRSDFRVKFTLQGLKRVLGDKSCRKSPLLPVDLYNISNIVERTSITDFAIWVCVVVAFRTLLRKSNLLPGELMSTHCVRRANGA